MSFVSLTAKDSFTQNKVMQKILLVMNAHKPDTASINFACHMAVEANALTGLFVENLYERHQDPGALYFQNTLKKNETELVAMNTDQAVMLFINQCTLQKIKVETYIDTGEPIEQVISESRFADLLIVDPKMSFYGAKDQLPSHFIKEILEGAECPVILAPEEYTDTKEIVFCYDGSASSVYAMKQFTYLLPQFGCRKTVLLEVNRSGKAEFGKDHRRLMQWLQAHYPSVIYQSLKGQAKDELFAYFFMHPGRFAVMGSYGRSQLSTFFKHSTADILIRTVDLPLFITHH